MSQKQLKALSGKDFQSHPIATELNPKKSLVINLRDLEEIIKGLALKGNTTAIEFAIIMMGLALEQLFCDAFNIRFEKEERQLWLKERQESKFYRRTLTDAIKHLKEQNVSIEYSHITMSVYQACQLRETYLAYKRHNNDHYFRDTLSDKELRKVAKMEELTADYIMVDDMPYKLALIKAARYIR